MNILLDTLHHYSDTYSDYVKWCEDFEVSPSSESSDEYQHWCIQQINADLENLIDKLEEREINYPLVALEFPEIESHIFVSEGETNVKHQYDGTPVVTDCRYERTSIKKILTMCLMGTRLYTIEYHPVEHCIKVTVYTDDGKFKKEFLIYRLLDKGDPQHENTAISDYSIRHHLVPDSYLGGIEIDNLDL